MTRSHVRLSISRCAVIRVLDFLAHQHREREVEQAIRHCFLRTAHSRAGKQVAFVFPSWSVLDSHLRSDAILSCFSTLILSSLVWDYPRISTNIVSMQLARIGSALDKTTFDTCERSTRDFCWMDLARKKE